jgi:HSP20 family molecular chaperone IbpA
MPDSQSPDDIFRYLMKMMEELAGEMSADKTPHFIGYTIVSTPGEAPRVVRITNRSPCELPYELVEGPTHYYITIELPPDLDSAPVVDIDLKKVTVQVGGREMAIDLPQPVDRVHCSYELRRGLLDIVCQKA